MWVCNALKKITPHHTIFKWDDHPRPDFLLSLQVSPSRSLHPPLSLFLSVCNCVVENPARELLLSRHFESRNCIQLFPLCMCVCFEWLCMHFPSDCSNEIGPGWTQLKHTVKQLHNCNIIKNRTTMWCDVVGGVCTGYCKKVELFFYCFAQLQHILPNRHNSNPEQSSIICGEGLCVTGVEGANSAGTFGEGSPVLIYSLRRNGEGEWKRRNTSWVGFEKVRRKIYAIRVRFHFHQLA